MRTRAITIVTTLVLLFFPIGIVFGQKSPDQEILERLTKLEDELKIVQDAAMKDLTGRIAANETAIEKIAQSVVSNGDAIRNLLTRIDNNDEAINEMNTQLFDLGARVGDNNKKLGDIAKEDGQGGWYPNLLGNVQKPEFQQEVRAVVKQAGATQGRLWINNPNSFDHIIYINGSRWRALAGLSYVWVPFGNVSVSHVGGVTPPVRLAEDWSFNEQNRVYELTYDFSRPW